MPVHRRTKAGGISRMLLGLYWPLLVFGGISAAAYLIKGGTSALRAALLRTLESPSGSLGVLILVSICLLLTPIIIILTLKQQKEEQAEILAPSPSPDELFPELDYRLTPHAAPDSIQLLLDGKELLSMPAAPGSCRVQAGGLTLTVSISQPEGSQPQTYQPMADQSQTDQPQADQPQTEPKAEPEMEVSG